MDTTATLDELLSELDLTDSPELVRRGQKGLSSHEAYLLESAELKLDVDAVLLQPSSSSGSSFPLAYFGRVDEPKPENIAKAHKLAWNMGDAPLLFVTLPGEIRIYSTFERPRIKGIDRKFDDKAGLIEPISLLERTLARRERLKKYSRLELLSGRFWEQNKERFKPNTRVEQTLLVNLSAIRQRLLSDRELTPEIVHGLLGRTIFIKYLEDRKDRAGNSVFPDGFFERFGPNARNFLDVLGQKKGTYDLFHFLEDKFNGDTFPTSSHEYRVISKGHLSLLSGFLGGKEKLSTAQLALWPYYSFNVLPIEFISNLYEEFFHTELSIQRKGKPQKSKKSKAGTYYTPHRLVQFLMDEVLPWEGEETDITILDPACGSGIFLVEAYRRLINRWRRNKTDERLSTAPLKEILTGSIHGVDSNPEAVRVAAFSLYLTMCDYLEPRHIWNRVQFPFLKDHNLWSSDFFDFLTGKKQLPTKFDLVIGNPPWESQLSDSAQAFVKGGIQAKPIGDEQIAQAFLWGAPQVCKESGEVALVAPSKGLLFNSSDTNRAFRSEFFARFKVSTVVNFSALRRTIFDKAVGPAACIIFRPVAPSDSSRILYCCPKPQYSPEDSWLYLVEPQDISYIPIQNAQCDPIVWKVAMWGNPRDLELMRKLSSLPSLEEVCGSRNWAHGEGFIVGDGKHAAEWLTGKPLVPPEILEPFVITESTLPPLKERGFNRPRTKNRDIFKGPHILISLSPKRSQGFIAALLQNYAVFTHAIAGIGGPPSDEKMLASACMVINSQVSLYYALMSSGVWLVERDELTKTELLALPIPERIANGEVSFSYQDLMGLKKSYDSDEAVNKLVTPLFDLGPYDKKLIEETLAYTLNFFYKGGQADVKARPIDDMLIEYGRTICDVLNSSFGNGPKGFSAVVFVGDAPMTIVQLTLDDPTAGSLVKIGKASGELTSTIKRIDKYLTEKQSGGVFFRRNARVYIDHQIYIVKRNQRRHWSVSAALRDADETYADIMNNWRPGSWH